MNVFKVSVIIVVWASFNFFANAKNTQAQDLAINPLNKQIAEIDVLFVYANNADQSFDGGAENWIKRLVEITNQAMTDSHVYIRINNVGMEAVEYSANANFSTALVDIQSGVHEGLIDIDNLRYERGADVVSFIVSSENECGEAFGNAQITGKAHEMYHVIGIGCSDEIFAHELGHNLGLAHSRPQEQAGGFTFEYALGHGVDSSFATIMTYPQFFNASSETVLQYSNSENTCNGYPCGVGREKSGEGADAAFALNQIRFQAQSLYSATPSLLLASNVLSNIGDNQLAICIEEHLVARNIKYAEALHTLECVSREITSIAGIEHFSQLNSLNLSNNRLDSIVPLIALQQLSELYISNTGVDNITPLSDLENVGILGVTDNQISDLSPLTGMRHLRDLDLNNNHIVNLAPLAVPTRRWTFLNASANPNLYCWQKDYFIKRFTANVFFSDDACEPATDDSDYDGDGVANSVEINNDSSPFVSAVTDGQLVFSMPVFRINEGAQQVMVSVKRTSGSQPISATLSAVSDSATIDSDVFIENQDIMLARGQDELQVIANIADDAQLEFVEKMVIVLEQNGAPVSYASVVIDDNEQTLQWVETEVEANEADGNVALNIELLRSTDQAAAVNFTIKPITAFFGNGNDYLVERGTVDFAQNEQVQTLIIPLHEDSFSEPNETFMITLVNPSQANLGEQTVAIVTIVDDDSEPSPIGPVIPDTQQPGSSGGSLSIIWLIALWSAVVRRKYIVWKSNG